MTEFFGEQSHNDDWGAGYSAGQAGMNKAIATAAFIERQRIIKLLHDNIGWCEALEYEYFADELEKLINGDNK